MEHSIASHDVLTTGRPRVVECGRESLMIHLGSISSEKRRDLAIRAIQKVRRCWNQGAHMIVSATPGRGCDAALPPRLCNLVTQEALDSMVKRHRAAGRLYVPTASESCDELALFALASGVPLDAISLVRQNRATAYRTSQNRFGDAYLLVDNLSH